MKVTCLVANTIIRKLDENSMRQQLDTALDSETKLRRKLMDQVPHRDRDRGSCRCNYALTETTTAKLTEIKPSNTQ
ncbi:unnamed protein product, partial [Timema podura]|nr:unnamed protein product [Timema podura]